MTAIENILTRGSFGIKPGLERMEMACAAMGNPQLALGRVVHVAGTNGKGQTCALVDAALRSRGYRTCRYTSPHLVKVNERFFANGRIVTDDELETAAKRTLPNAGDLTYFEALTLVAFELFRGMKPDFTILETGLGGRLDATNVCRPEVTAITRIGLDHCQWLGGTIEAIAAEKAGIQKPGAVSILGPNDNLVREVVKADVNVACDGDFEDENKAVAAAILDALGEKGFSPATLPDAVWPGRMQQIGRYLVDGAHNPPGAAALVKAISRRHSGKEFSLVYGACADKDADGVLSILSRVAKRGYGVRINNPRALSASAVCGKMRSAGIAAQEWDMDRLGEIGGDVLICGSLFLVGEALVKLGAYPWGEERFDPEEGGHARK